ncbi:MAG: PAS domain-containing protein [Sulfurovum sp.]|nr:PAS domain-containing protein [Sulfurovum sp.]NNJ44809.1 PAS domain-containing protein [Sulfurovum sp.]
MINAFITGIIVSTLGFVCIHSVDPYYQLFILASLLGLTAGATTSLSSDIRIAITYISIIMIPLISSMIMINTSLSVILAILMILFFLSQVIMIRQSYAQAQKIKELNAQKNLLNNLFSEAPLGMFSYDKNLNIIYANEQLRYLFEYKDMTIMGLNLGSMFDSNIIEVFKKILTHGTQSYSGSYITAKDSHLWIKITGFPFTNTNDDVLGGMGIIEDKTKEYTHTKELESLHKKLKDQIEHNQLLLTENKEFIADMVHQIRTPLSVIMTNTSLIEMKSESEVSSYITQINSAINMLSNSYEDLSYIISNDTIDYKATDIDLSYFLDERIDFFEVIADANDKTISTSIESNIKVTMNDTELERLIDNNLSNAIKHSCDKSNIEIVLEKSNSDIVLQFISKGTGIRDVTKLFEKNYTESHGAKRSLGLGLNMVKTICEKNNIIYSANSEDNTNTFTYIFKG